MEMGKDTQKAVDALESQNKAVSKGKGYKTSKGGTLYPGSGNQKRSHRFEMAKALVEAGDSPTNAMRRAGYSENTARQSAGKYPVKAALMKARDKFMLSFVKGIKKEKMDGQSTLKRLSKIVHSSDDYNANQAIRTFSMILLKNAPQSDEGMNFFGVFVVPESKFNDNWKNEAKEVKDIHVSALIHDAEVVEK